MELLGHTLTRRKRLKLAPILRFRPARKQKMEGGKLGQRLDGLSQRVRLADTSQIEHQVRVLG